MSLLEFILSTMAVGAVWAVPFAIRELWQQHRWKRRREKLEARRQQIRDEIMADVNAILDAQDVREERER